MGTSLPQSHCCSTLGAPQPSSAASSLPDLLCSRQQYCVLCHWVLPRAMVLTGSSSATRRPPQRIRRAGPARAPWGQCGAVCSFAVSQQWEQWEAPQCVGAGNSHSGRASLGTLCAIVLGLVFTLYSMHLPEKLQK